MVEAYTVWTLGIAILPAHTRVRLADFVGTFSDFGLTNVEIQEKSGTNAYRCPTKCLIVFDGRSAVGDAPVQMPEKTPRPEISVLEVTPALLRNYGVKALEYMVKPSRFLG